MKRLAWIGVAIALQSAALASAQAPPPPQVLVVPPGYTQAEAPPPAPTVAPAPAPVPTQPYAQPVYGPQPIYGQPAYGAQPQQVAAPTGPDRQGFTLELGLGIAWLSQPSSSYSEVGLYGLTVSLGGFVSPSLAIEARITGASILGGYDSVTFENALAAVQFWPNDWLSIGAGIGVSMAQDSSYSSDLGFALDARLGAAVARWSSGVMRVAVEFVPAWPQGELVTMAALGVEYQYY